MDFKRTAAGRGGRRWIWILGALLAVAAAAFVFTQERSAPAVTFTTLKGETLPMQALRGKVVLVNFWATDCPGCIAEMPDLVRTYQKFRGRGFEVVAVAMQYDPPNYVVNFTERNALPFPVALDLQGEHARAFGEVNLTPTAFLIDPQGRIVQRVVGELDFQELRAYLERQLPA